MKHIVENTDLRFMPSVIQQEGNSTITIGDIHSNALLFVHLLIKHNVITDCSPIIYNELVNSYVYYRTSYFLELLEQLTFNRHTKIRMLGDDLADRGQHDVMVLYIYKMLHKNKVKFNVILSNHNIEFIKYAECVKSGMDPRNVHQSMNRRYVGSLHNLIDDENIDNKDILRMYYIYKNRVKLIDYDVLDDNTVVLYSHAPSGLNTIPTLYSHLGLEYSDKSIKDLTESIDKLNIYLKKSYLDNYKLHMLYSSKQVLQYFVWDRDYIGISTPTEYNGFNIKYVHGHDMSGNYDDNHVSLDGMLGKIIDNTQGIYSVIIT